MIAGEAQQRELLGFLLGQGQGAVVLEQDGALLADALAQILDGIQQLGGGGIVRCVGIDGGRVRFLGDDLGGLSAQELVNVGAEAVDNSAGGDAQRQDRCAGGRNAAPYALAMAAGGILLHDRPP